MFETTRFLGQLLQVGVRHAVRLDERALGSRSQGEQFADVGEHELDTPILNRWISARGRGLSQRGRIRQATSTSNTTWLSRSFKGGFTVLAGRFGGAGGELTHTYDCSTTCVTGALRLHINRKGIASKRRFRLSCRARALPKLPDRNCFRRELTARAEPLALQGGREEARSTTLYCSCPRGLTAAFQGACTLPRMLPTFSLTALLPRLK